MARNGRSPAEMLLIADETKAVALAGVMGGQNSEINLNTADVLIESAYFKPQNIRATSKNARAAHRIFVPVRARRRYWHLRLGQPARRAVDPGNRRRRTRRTVSWTPIPSRSNPSRSRLRHHKVNELLGIELTPEQIEAYLASSS